MLSLTPRKWKQAYLPTIARDKAADFNSAPPDKTAVYKLGATIWNI